jgi:hypothetical protein
MAPEASPPDGLLRHVSQQLRVNPVLWQDYAQRAETRREHALELQVAFGYRPFTAAEYRLRRGSLTDFALQTNKAIVVAQQLVEMLRKDGIIVPLARVVDRLCAEALARGNRLFYQHLTEPLNAELRVRLDKLLTPREDARTIVLTWLGQPPGEAKARNILRHLDRLEVLREVRLPADLERLVHHGRLTQLAREGAQMNAQHLRDLEDVRRHATLAAVLLDTQATVIDESLDMDFTMILSASRSKADTPIHERTEAICRTRSVLWS